MCLLGRHLHTRSARLASTYSTVYVGGNGAWASEYGESFLGLAEKVDVGNQDPADNAFIFSDTLCSDRRIAKETLPLRLRL